MKKNCLLCFLLFFSCHSALAGESLDSLLNVLDKTIKEADTYVQIKENKLHELKKEARKTPPFSVERYNLNNDIYLEYKAYSSDSALHYLNENMLLARQLNDKERELKIQLELSYLLPPSECIWKQRIYLTRLIVRHCHRLFWDITILVTSMYISKQERHNPDIRCLLPAM